GPPRQRESYTLTAPATAPQAGAWELVLRSDRPRFVRRVDMTAEAPDGSMRRIVDNGSLFRLPNIAKEKTQVTLPPLAGARLTITLEGEDGFFLEPRLAFESARFLDPREEASVPLQELARRAADGRTILELARPRGLVPDVLRLETATPAFDRAVEVWDVRPGGSDVLLGRASLFRLEAIAAVGESEMTLGPARGERLRVEIVDGDRARLEGLAFAVAVRRPSLVFSLASGGGEEPAAILYFGGGRAYAPRYDLAGLLPASGQALAGERASAAARLRDPSAAVAARLGRGEANPFFDGAPALGLAMRPGAEVDKRQSTLAEGRLVQRIGKPRPVSLAFPPARVVALELVVQDGDDAPLEFRAARARLVLPELFLAAPAGDYFLLVGDPKASAPSY